MRALSRSTGYKFLFSEILRSTLQSFFYKGDTENRHDLILCFKGNKAGFNNVQIHCIDRIPQSFQNTAT